MTHDEPPISLTRLDDEFLVHMGEESYTFSVGDLEDFATQVMRNTCWGDDVKVIVATRGHAVTHQYEQTDPLGLTMRINTAVLEACKDHNQHLEENQ